MHKLQSFPKTSREFLGFKMLHLHIQRISREKFSMGSQYNSTKTAQLWSESQDVENQQFSNLSWDFMIQMREQ